MKMKKIVILSILLSASSALFSQTTRPVVSDINSLPKNSTSVKITWTLPENSVPEITGCYIYRDSRQITTFDQLSKLTPVGSVDADVTTFTDTLTDTKDYFYCVLCSTENGVYNIILPSVNTTVSGVHVASAYSDDQQVITPNSSSINKKKFTDASEKMRDIPLPTPGLIEVNKKSQNILGTKAMNTADELGRNYTGSKSKITKLHVFEEDLICPKSGDEYYLFKILKNSFVKKEFKKAVNDLDDFLSIHRNAEVTKRASFYLGESYYFSREYEKAVFQFLKVQNDYPELAKKWIDSSLDLINLK
nr:hypothetical protein [uncultured Treponema sp.]